MSKDQEEQQEEPGAALAEGLPEEADEWLAGDYG